MRKPARPRLAALAAALVAALAAVVACTPGESRPGEPSTSSTADPTGATGEPVTLRFAVYGDEALVASYTELAEAFTRSNPRITVDVLAARDATAAQRDLQSTEADGLPPDVFLSASDQLPRLVSEARVQPVDTLLEDRGIEFGDGYQREGLEAFSADSALQCMPHDVSPLVVYYNERLLDPSQLVDDVTDPGPTARSGWSFDQFSLAARRIARGGTANGVHIEPDLEMLAPFIWSGGGDLVDDLEEPTSLALSGDDTRAVLEALLTLFRDQGVTPTRAQLSRKDAVQRFARGRLGMILGTRGVTPQLRAARGLDFEAFPLPNLGSYRTVSSITGYCISSTTSHVEEAADLVAFAAGREGASITSRSGYVVPANVTVVTSPAFTQPTRQPRNAFLFSETVRRADETPRVAGWPKVVRETRPLLEQMYYARVINLDVLLPQIDLRSQTILAPEEPPETE